MGYTTYRLHRRQPHRAGSENRGCVVPVENYRALPVLRPEPLRTAAGESGWGEADIAARALFKRLRKEGEYLRRPDFAAVDAEFVGVLIGLAEGGKYLEGMRLP
jgi:hypothetical protein